MSKTIFDPTPDGRPILFKARTARTEPCDRCGAEKAPCNMIHARNEDGDRVKICRTCAGR